MGVLGHFLGAVPAASFCGFPFVVPMKDDDFSLEGDGGNQDVNPVFEMGADHWEEEIVFLERRLRGEQGDIDQEDKEACQEALAIAKANLADCLKRQK